MVGITKVAGFFAAVIFILAVVVYLRNFERQVIFYPEKKIEFLPAAAGLEHKDVFFRSTDNVKLHGWFIPVGSSRCTILFCHGNAGNVGDRLEKLKFFHGLGCSTFIFDYRGYGKSAGSPSEKGLYRDAQAAYDYLVAQAIPKLKIIGFGESLGGAVIIDLASRNELKAVMLEGTFSCAKDMAQVMYPYLPHWLFWTRWDSLTKIKSVIVPKLFFHSPEDEVVPYRLGRKLFEFAPEPKEFIELRGNHNDSFLVSAALIKEKSAQFLKRALQ